VKIAVLSESFLMGGLETRLKGIFKRVQGHEVCLVVKNYDKSNTGLFDDIRISAMDKQNIKRALQSVCPDIVDVHPYNSLIEGAAACMELGLPYVATIHGPYINSQYIKALEGAKCVFAVSEEVESQVRLLAKNANVIVLRNGIDLERFKPVYAGPGGKTAVIARLDGDKYPGVKKCLDAFPMADVIGTGTMLNNLQKEYSSARFLGYKDIAEHFGEYGADYSLIAGMGRVALEGIAMGYPVLLVGYDGIKGFITPESFERLSYRNFSGRGEPNTDIDELFPPNKKLRDMLRKNHDEKKVASQYFDIIEKLFKRKKGDKDMSFNEGMFLKEFKEFVDKLGVNTALEVGCQSGEMSQIVGADGIDLDPQVEGVNKADILEYKSAKKYDLVYSSGLLEHFTSEKAIEVIKKMAGLSKKYVLNYVPNGECVAYMKCKSQTDADWKDELDYTQETLEELHIRAGLKIAKSGLAGQEWAKLFGSEPSEPYLVWVLATKR